MTIRVLRVAAACALLGGCVAAPRPAEPAPSTRERTAAASTGTATEQPASHGTTTHSGARGGQPGALSPGQTNPNTGTGTGTGTGTDTGTTATGTNSGANTGTISGANTGTISGANTGTTSGTTLGVPGEMPPPPPREVLAAIGDAQPRVETRTRRGNPPVYNVLGQTYQLLRSAAGYRERGVASWYGPDFHAKSTANGEPYDMYAMTAAHRTLPIPVYLKVTNLANGKSVTVRVNDRGPFKHNRIVDLSYTAAMKLDMLRHGTALVEVEAVLPPGDDGLLPEMTPAMAASAPRAPSVPKLTALATGGLLYAQVGAFGVKDNAFALRDRLNDGGVNNVLVVRVKRDGQTLWRVRIGPIGSVENYDTVVDQLERLGIREISLARLAVPAASDEAQAAD